MSFIIYDITFLVVFLVFVSLFLYRGKKNLKKEGILLLYKTTWGVKLINKVGKKYVKTLNVLGYISIAMGYLLMIFALYFVGKIVWIYLFNQAFVQAVKVPPIMPLFPYLPQAMNIDLPPFYFTYWILIIALIAIFHEFAHGIFAAKDKVKIRNTGFGFFPFFFPIFLAAFVELDEPQMAKKSKFSQMAVLSAGTFANILTGLLFFIILIIFFSFAFQPAGIVYDDYIYSVVPISVISLANNISLDNPTYDELIDVVNLTGENTFIAEDIEYIGIKGFTNNKEGIALYDKTPAAETRLESIIFKVNGVEVKNTEIFSQELSKYSPGETITLNVLGNDGEDYDKDLTLIENPENKSKGLLGVAFYKKDTSIMSKIILWFSSFKDSNTHYAPKLGEFSIFIYNLLWWIVLISISVALLNMLPVGIFDGGRFFYLTVLGLTKNKKIAEKSFKFMTQFILFLVVVLMVAWVIGVF